MAHRTRLFEVAISTARQLFRYSPKKIATWKEQIEIAFECRSFVVRAERRF